MVNLKYDKITARQAGYPGNPDHTMKELGYQNFRVIYSINCNFYEVERAIEPLPPFLEKSDVVDGRFDPRDKFKCYGPGCEDGRIVPDSIDLGDSRIHFHQDPNVFMTVDFGPKGETSSGDVKGGKASE